MKEKLGWIRDDGSSSVPLLYIKTTDGIIYYSHEHGSYMVSNLTEEAIKKDKRFTAINW